VYSRARRAFIDYRKYPFIVNIGKFIKERYAEGVSILDIVSFTRGKIVERAEERIINALKKGSIPNPPADISTDEEVLAYYLSLILLGFINDKWLITRYADAEAKRVYEHLVKDEDVVLEAIGKLLGIDVQYLGEKKVRIPYMKIRDKVMYIELPYAIHYVDYIKATLRLSKDPSWKLTNQFLKKGYVYLDKRKFARLLEEVIRDRICSSVEYIEEIPDQFKPLIDKLMGMIKEIRGEMLSKAAIEGAQTAREYFEKLKERIQGQVFLEAFPPCMSRLYNAIVNGENLSHHERFAIATFLLHIGMDVESVLNVFRNVPDFNERIARYQIEHLAGLRGSKKQYMPYSCATMKTLGLCVSECNVRNPLVYYWREVRKMIRKSREKSK